MSWPDFASGFESCSESWLDWCMASSWQLTLLICLIALLVAVLRGASPRVRYALWLLVIVKVFLPPTISAPWSIGSWVVEPMSEQMPQVVVAERSPELKTATPPAADSATLARRGTSLAEVLFIIWIAGVLVFSLTVTVNYLRIRRMVRALPTIDEGPVRVALESIALRIGLRRPPEIHVAADAGSPFLLGLLSPRIVIPGSLVNELSESEMRDVLTHELIHLKQYDPWFGWLQVVSQTLFWFHPFVWWANSQLRHQRECVCDDIALRSANCEPKRYGETIVRVLTEVRGRSPVTGGLLGVFERGSRIQDRVESIMSFEANKGGFGWVSRSLVVGVALFVLPMSPGVSQEKARKTATASKPQAAPYPVIEQTKPGLGETAVDPGLKEITVTFDRDMGAGMSWTGGPPMFPPVDSARTATWIDKRTCVLPVKLEKGKYYRLGINSKSYHNFAATDGTAAPPAVIAFTTKGASDAQQAKVRVPQVVSIKPANGADNVKSSLKALRVTFDVPMAGGMSWTGGGEGFPKLAAGKKPHWSSDRKTCVLPVALSPGKSYRLGLNSLSHNNFQSEHGIPIPPIVYEFTTAD